MKENQQYFKLNAAHQKRSFLRPGEIEKGKEKSLSFSWKRAQWGGKFFDAFSGIDGKGGAKKKERGTQKNVLHEKGFHRGVPNLSCCFFAMKRLPFAHIY